jgi:hypothetical protein
MLFSHMPQSFWIRVSELVFVFLLAAVVYFTWREERQDRIQLAAAHAEARQTLAHADVRQHDRDAQLIQTLADIAKLKQAANTQITRGALARTEKQYFREGLASFGFPSGAPPRARREALLERG